MPLAAGRRLGVYEVIAPLGAGGMGEVYRARDSRLARDVAIKVLPEPFAQDAAALTRFEREARAVAALSHPNILAIHDFGTDGGTVYAVMELLEGRTLRAWLKAGTPPARRTIDYAIQIADGLAAAHERGLVHRDVKPDNIFVTSDDRVKILDFGLAKPIGAPVVESSASETRTTPLLSEPGVVLGTVGYMSPEQVKGRPADHRSDIFSLGVVLWEMLSGRRAFERPSAAETMAAILHDEPSDLTSAAGSVPAGLVRVAQHCLEKDPSQRFQSARDLSFALRSLVSVPVDSERASAQLPSVARSVIPLPEGAWLSGEAAPVLAITRDGTRVAYVALTGDGVPRLYVYHVDRGETQGVPQSDYAAGPFFSPDGRWVGFAADLSPASARAGELRKHSFSSGLTQTVCALPWYEGACWGEDGAIYFVGDVLLGLQRVPATGGEPEPVIEKCRVGGALVPRCLGCPRLLPDGRSALVIDWDASSLGDTSLLNLTTGDLHSLASTGSAGTAASTGHLLYTQTDGLLVAAPLDRRSGKLSGPPTAVASDVALDAAGGAFALSDTGTLVFARGQLRGSVFEIKQLVRIDPSGRAEPIALPPGPLLVPPSVSPDGRHVVVCSRTHGLWIADLERGTRQRLRAGMTRLARCPIWSPDGERIVFRGATLGQMGWKVFVQRSDGSDEPQVLFGDDAVAKTPRSFTPDGSTVLCEISSSDREQGLWAFPLPGGRPRRCVLSGSIDDSALSPDGRLVAYQSGEFGSVEIFLRLWTERGHSVQVTTTGGRCPRWSPDGREIFYVSGDRLMAVPVDAEAADLSGGSSRVVLERPNVQGFVVSADGSIITVERLPNSGLVRQLQLVTGWFQELRALSPSHDS